MTIKQRKIPKALFDVQIVQSEGSNTLDYTVQTIPNYGPKKDRIREGHHLSFWALKEVDEHYILEKTIIGDNMAPLGSIQPIIDREITIFGVEDKTHYEKAKQRLLEEARTFAQEYATREYAVVQDLTLEERTRRDNTSRAQNTP